MRSVLRQSPLSQPFLVQRERFVRRQLPGLLNARPYDESHLIVAVFLRFPHGADTVFLGSYVDVVFYVRVFFDRLVPGHLFASLAAVCERPTIFICAVFDLFVGAFFGQGIAALDGFFDFRNVA